MMSVALRAAGLQLRSADPAAMRDFLVAVNARAAEAAAQGAMTPRAEVSLAVTILCAGNAQKLFVMPHSSPSDSCYCVHARPVPGLQLAAVITLLYLDGTASLDCPNTFCSALLVHTVAPRALPVAPPGTSCRETKMLSLDVR
jgi:hypothetical protein